MKKELQDKLINTPVEELLQLMNDWGLHGLTSNLENDINYLLSECKTPNPRIDISFIGKISQGAKTMVSSWMGPDVSLPENTDTEQGEQYTTCDLLDLHYIFKPVEHLGVNKTGQMQSSLLILILGDEKDTYDIAEFEERLLNIAEDYAGIILVETSLTINWNKSIDEDLADSVLLHKKFGVDEINESSATLCAFLAAQIKPEKLHLLKINALLKSLEGIQQTFLLFIQQEERRLKSHQARNQQQLLKLQNTSSGNLQDLPQRIKQAVQQHYDHFERGISRKFEKYFSIQTGEFSQTVEESLSEMPKLIMDKQHKSYDLAIPAQFTQEYLQAIREQFDSLSISDIMALNDTQKIIEQELNTVYSEAGIDLPPLQFKHLTAESLQEILDNIVRIDKPYSSSMNRKGGYEYFMAIRRFQMIFFMMASTFGISFVGKKNDNSELKILMLVVTGLLLSFGTFSVIRSAKKEKKNRLNKETQKAKESLIAEAKRMANELSRQWLKQISDHIRMQSSLVINELENTIKTSSEKIKKKTEDDKRKLQRLLQNAEQSGKKTDLAKRGLETWQRTLTKSKNDLKLAIMRIKD